MLNRIVSDNLQTILESIILIEERFLKVDVPNKFVTSPEGVILLDAVSMRLQVIGELTKESLIKEGISPNILPKTFSYEGIIEELKKHNLKNKIIEILRSTDGSKTLIEELKKLNANVYDTHVYFIQLPKNLEKAKNLIKKSFK